MLSEIIGFVFAVGCGTIAYISLKYLPLAIRKISNWRNRIIDYKEWSESK